MIRLDWVYVKACVPGGVVAIGTLFIALKLEAMQGSSFFVGIAILAPWVTLAGFAAALLLVAVPTWGLWRWKRGKGPMCPRCDGPLGRETSGRFGPYRRCLACGSTTSSPYYS